MTNIVSCIDGSAISKSVCDAGAWASRKLNAPLMLLHVLEKSITPAKEDFSGSIGLGTREHLLDELTELDQKRSKLALEHGKHMLDAAEGQARADGATEISKQQRHGNLLETLQDLESETRLIVMGRLGEGHEPSAQAIGSQIESVVRAMHHPILITVGEFMAPTSVMICYDGSSTADASIERLASSPILKGLECHLVMVGADTQEHQKQLQDAGSLLRQKGYETQSHLLEGDVQKVLSEFQTQHGINLIVMGAYGHSRIRQFFVGSNTTKMISHSTVPLLLLR